MTKEPKYSRSDWLPVAMSLRVGEVIRIQPRENLTAKDAVAALNAQRVSGCRVMEHGTVIWVRRMTEGGESWEAYDFRGRVVAR